MAIETRWICWLTEKTPTFSIQYYADQNLAELCAFWGETLAIDANAIMPLRKSNSNQLTGHWRSRHGVLNKRVPDTLLRVRIQAWMDCLRTEWQ
jgi:hypothetical protein